MIGKQQIQLDSRQFLQGLATSDYMPDGGLGTSSYNLNLIGQTGVVRATGSSAPTGDTLADKIIGSCEDPRPSSSSFGGRFLVDDVGKLYTLDNNTLTLRNTPASSSGYIDPTTDMVVFQGAIYISKTTDIVKVTVTNLSTYTVDESWWDTTLSQSALTGLSTVHPMLVFENQLWIGDSEKLHTVTTGDVASTALTLNTNDRITALGIDPGSGLMLIGIATYAGSSGDNNARYFVSLYDGYSSKVRRRIPVDGLVTSFKSVGGSVFVGLGNTIGLWNGAGVTFLRRLKNVSTISSQLPYKPRMSNFQNTLLVADGPELLAYGDIANGKKVWYPIYKNQVNSNNVGFVSLIVNTTVDGSSATALSPVIAVNDTSTSLRMVEPMDTTQAATGVMYTPKINFERPVNIHRVRVFTTGITTTAGIGGVALIDETGTTRTPTVSTMVVLSGASPRYAFDFDYGSLKLQELQGKFTIDTQAFGITRAVIYYDVAE